MRIDPKSANPIFRQIADRLRNQIRRSVYRPGEMLPSLRALALEIQVNPNTVQRAYELLEREGVVESRRGVGIFVCALDSELSRRVEIETLGRFEKVIQRCLKSNMPPERIRAVFEQALHRHLQENDV